jgi:hypothetical protein
MQSIPFLQSVNLSVSWVVKSESYQSESVSYSVVTCLDCLSKFWGLIVSCHQQDPEHAPSQESDSEFFIFP